MSDAEDSFPDSDSSAEPVVDSSEIASTIQRIQAAHINNEWEQDVPLSLKTKQWRPSAVNASRESLLYVALRREIPRFIVTRLIEAYQCGLGIHVALNLESLYLPDILTVLADVDAEIFVLNDGRTADLKPLHFMAALADLDVPVEPPSRVAISRTVYSRIKSGSNQQKGRRFEALLAFLFSQVSDFRVVERNLRTATQEIDLVLQIHNHSQRAWQQQVPYMLVEAKNTTDPTPQKVVSSLMTKILYKGQTCKSAMLVSVGGFTSDAMNEELRYSHSENRIILIGREDLEKVIDSGNLDDTLDMIVRRGRMR